MNLAPIAAMIMAFFLLLPYHAFAQDKSQPYQPPSLFLEELTWPEVKQALAEGYTRVLIPTAGTEQNGSHMILGKHNRIAAYTAEHIAKRKGHTLIAPVIAYVPEEMHMAYAGTLSLTEETFAAMLSETVDSLKHHGFKQIYFLGESFGNQPPQQEVVEDRAEDDAKDKVLLATLNEYYDANGQMDWLKKQGFTEEEIGGHAGIRDTSEMMVVYPQGIRKPELLYHRVGDSSGANGRADAASEVIGRKMLSLKIKAALRQIDRLEAAFKKSH